MTTELTATDLLNCGELVDIRILEFSAGLRDNPREDLDEDDVVQNLEVGIGSGASTVEVRVKAHIETKAAEYRAIVAMQYRYESDQEPSEAVVREFAERAGVAAVYPYMRELIQANSMRLRQEPITMPFLRLGSVTLKSDDAP